MKTTLKKLAKAIWDVLEQNEKANYFNGLFDCGEWSCSTPDFSKLIKDWHLNRRRLNLWTWIAYEYAREFEKRFPHRTYRYNKYGPYVHNPWLEVWEALNTIFMAGFLTHKVERWIDPAGGVHFDDPNSDEFDDPARMYE